MSRNTAADYIGAWFQTYTGEGVQETDSMIESADDCLDQMREDHKIIVIDTQDKATVERIAHAVWSVLPVDLGEKRAKTYAAIATNALIREFTVESMS